MNARHPVTQLSRGQGPAVFRYYDVAVESPGGMHLVYSEFIGGIPGPCRVIVAERDGARPRVVGEAAYGIGHSGANPVWLDDHTISFLGDAKHNAMTVVHDLRDGSERRIERVIRSFHCATGRGVLFARHASQDVEDPESHTHYRKLWLWDRGADHVRPLLHVDQVIDLHPLRDRFDREHVHFMNSKFSPDGSRIAVVFSNQMYLTAHPQAAVEAVKSIIVLEVQADRPNPRYLGEFADHPMWTPSGRAVLSHRHEAGVRTVMAHPLDGSPVTPVLAGMLGVHSSLNRAQTHLVTDIFNYPAPGRAAVAVYDMANGQFTVLAEGVHEKTDHVAGSHPHPQFSRDESRIFFNHADTGVPQVYAVEWRGA